MPPNNLLRQLREIRQLSVDSRVLLTNLHEQRFHRVEGSSASQISPISPLQLIVPAAFYAEVQRYRLSSHGREQLSNILHQISNDYSEQFDNTARKLSEIDEQHAPKIIKKFRESLQHHFEHSALSAILDQLAEFGGTDPTRLTTSPLQAPNSLPQRSVVQFNKDYTPILETYFEYDAYPSARDQEIIAERSGMSKRQINVWFQNRRRTSRKNGQSFKGRRPPGSDAPSVSVPFVADDALEKQKMLDLFKNDPDNAKMTSPLGVDSGLTSDDPICISGEEFNLTDEVGMMISSVGSGVFAVEPIDVVEKLVREKERKLRDEDMKEERSKHLSLIIPRYPAASNLLPPEPTFASGSLSSINPLNASVTPNGAPPSTYPALYTRPPPETRFRLDPNQQWNSRPTFSPPVWSRVASDRSDGIPATTILNNKISFKRGVAQLSEAEKAVQRAKDEAFTRDWNTMLERLERYRWGLDSNEGSHSPPSASSESSSLPENSRSKSPSAAKDKSRTEHLRDLWGVCLDAATSAYTYVLPQAPFKALITTPALFTNGGTASSPQSQRRKSKKPAALGPKRQPRNAPSTSTSNKSLTVSPIASRESTPDIQRQCSTSSLSSSTGPVTPSPQPLPLPQGFPEGFTAVSEFQDHGIDVPQYYDFDENSTIPPASGSFLSMGHAKAPTVDVVVTPSSASLAHPSSSSAVPTSSARPAQIQTQVLDYAFGNPYSNAYSSNTTADMRIMHSGIDMINPFVSPGSIHTSSNVSHAYSGPTQWGVGGFVNVHPYLSLNMGLNPNIGLSYPTLPGGGMWAR